MGPDDVAAEIVRRVAVDHLLLTRAKDAVMRRVLEGVHEGGQLVSHAIRDLGAAEPGRLAIHPTVELEPQVKQAADYVSCHLAVCEALWSLLGAALLTPGHSGSLSLYQFNGQLQYTTAVQGSGQSGALSLPGVECTYPTRVLPAPSLRTNKHRSLSDGDLYLRDLAIASLHPLIEESLREAVRCFRYDLYLPCLAMLTRAAEGAWTELGGALAGHGARNGEATTSAKLRKDLVSPYYGLARRITDVAAYYKRRPLFDPVQRASGVGEQDIDLAIVWSDQVRDSRNVLHYGASAVVPNTYEKVAALMLGAIPVIRALHRATDTAR